MIITYGRYIFIGVKRDALNQRFIWSLCIWKYGRIQIDIIIIIIIIVLIVVIIIMYLYIFTQS